MQSSSQIFTTAKPTPSFFLLATCPQEGLPVHFYNIARAFTKVSCMEDIWVPSLVGSIHRKNIPASKAKMVIKQTS